MRRNGGQEGEDRIRPVFRFAPSPNGLMHLGHAYAAMTNLAMARAAGGIMLLRIEDIDRQRCTPAHEKAMLEDLEWLGFEWDEPPLRQSERFDLYRQELDGLLVAGFVYPSTASRGEIRRMVDDFEQGGGHWPRDPDGTPIYSGPERNADPEQSAKLLQSEGGYALRLHMDRAIAHLAEPLTWFETGAGPDGETGLVTADPQRWGDVILARKEIPASFHLCATLDDAWQAVTHVVRGRDIFPSTAIHRLLQELLGLPSPQYHHHALILDETGRKLSKSAGDTALRHLREAGMTPADILRMTGVRRD